MVAMAMATAKSSPAADIGEIQRQMAQVRHEMHQDVREAVQGAQSLTDWRSLVKSHPWLALATAAVTGYVLVPRRRSEAPAVVAVGVPTTGQAAVGPAHVDLSRPPAKTKTWGLIGSAIGLLAPVAIRAAQNYAAHYLEQRLAPQPDDGDRFGSPGSMPGSSGPGPHSARDMR
jgi:hypothetical protein